MAEILPLSNTSGDTETKTALSLAFDQQLLMEEEMALILQGHLKVSCGKADHLWKAGQGHSQKSLIVVAHNKINERMKESSVYCTVY